VSTIGELGSFLARESLSAATQEAAGQFDTVIDPAPNPASAVDGHMRPLADANAQVRTRACSSIVSSGTSSCVATPWAPSNMGAVPFQESQFQ